MDVGIQSNLSLLSPTSCVQTHFALRELYVNGFNPIYTLNVCEPHRFNLRPTSSVFPHQSWRPSRGLTCSYLASADSLVLLVIIASNSWLLNDIAEDRLGVRTIMVAIEITVLTWPALFPLFSSSCLKRGMHAPHLLHHHHHSSLPPLP